jgi:hypothetical protein
MKTSITRTAMVAMAAFTLVTASTGIARGNDDGDALRGSEAKQGGALQLEGTWLVQVTRRDCSTGTELESFQAMNSFASSGSFMEFGTTPAVTPAMRTPGFGNWNRIGPGRFRAVFSLFFLPDGVSVGSLHQIERVITMTAPGRFTADAEVRIMDPTGVATIATGCATETARRIS